MKLTEIEIEPLIDLLLEEETQLRNDARSARKAFSDMAVGIDVGPSLESAAEVIGAIARVLKLL